MKSARRASIAVLSVWALAACTGNSTPQAGGTVPPLSSGPTPARVVLVGDSLANEAAPHLEGILAVQEFVDHTFGGTAPCDWLDIDLGITPDSVVVLSFLGNSITECMAIDDGFLSGDALVGRYRADITALVDKARAAGAAVVLVGQPTLRNNDEGNALVVALDAMYREFAEAPAVSYVDAGAAVETQQGAFAQALPCLPGEPTCNAAGLVPVRSDDGVHFCPGPFVSPCPTHSSGAFRFAASIASAAQDPSAFD